MLDSQRGWTAKEIATKFNFTVPKAFDIFHTFSISDRYYITKKDKPIRVTMVAIHKAKANKRKVA
jgi:hypothetical protein